MAVVDVEAADESPCGGEGEKCRAKRLSAVNVEQGVKGLRAST